LILQVVDPPSHGGDGGRTPLGLPAPRASFTIVTAHMPPKVFPLFCCHFDQFHLLRRLWRAWNPCFTDHEYALL